MRWLALGFGLAALPAQAPVGFEADVLPILQAACFDCHRGEHTDATGRVRKPKGGLRLDGRGWILKGGKEGNVLTPGRAGQSPLYTRVVLPADHDDRMPANGGNAERITFEGTYNVTPRYSPDGKSFAFIQRSAGKYSLASMELASRQVQILTDGQLDGSPTFAPNGRLILYASIVRGRGILAAVSSDGRIKQKITASAQDVREPAWGPLMR